MRNAVLSVLGAGLLAGLPHAAAAQTDEIQVYNAQIAEPGVFNLTLHDNFTPDGRKTPAFPGAIVSNGSLNGVPEWAYGGGPLAPLKGFPGVVWERPRRTRRRDIGGEF